MLSLIPNYIALKSSGKKWPAGFLSFFVCLRVLIEWFTKDNTNMIMQLSYILWTTNSSYFTWWHSKWNTGSCGYSLSRGPFMFRNINSAVWNHWNTCKFCFIEDFPFSDVWRFFYSSLRLMWHCFNHFSAWPIMTLNLSWVSWDRLLDK